ncbi:tRNA pseudouridine synthase B [Natronincola peptidivorans]|uniref:tRNA pseudouridine synthase B n=2 Tax=Natronincola peptidivorans TaxID=426128 RepID=A0A1H9YHS9_9FIRM|nr:tRNA pseudouridine synthase B [Natronincola peptidivorans]
MTSHNVVARVRKITGIKKVGHTGTLDPEAAGVLPVCIGQATKISQYLLDSKKKYRAELTLGYKTDTQDASGTVIETKKVNSTPKEIEKEIIGFLGEYHQIPPMYSALKKNGMKLYDLARQGIEVDREPRRVCIHEVDIIQINENIVLFDVVCSKGTYIRTLCHDIGEKLNCGGMMSFLLRTANNRFDITSAITLEELEKCQDISALLKPIDYPLDHLPILSIDARDKKAALNGNKINLVNYSQQYPIETEVRAYVDNAFIGLGIIKEMDKNNKYIKFSRLFI